MKWNIDKAIEALEGTPAPGSVIERVLVNPDDAELLGNLKLKLTPAIRSRVNNENLQLVPVWCFGVGKLAQRKLFFHGWTIREAYLLARRSLKEMSKSDLEWYGVAVPRKSNSYAAAKRKHKPRAK